jgi:hypothetical protein
MRDDSLNKILSLAILPPFDTLLKEVSIFLPVYNLVRLVMRGARSQRGKRIGAAGDYNRL